MVALTFGSAVPTVDLGRIIDSMAWSQAFRRQNFSFVEHVQNQDQVKEGYRYLLDRAWKGEGPWTMFRRNQATKQGEWFDPQVQAYLTKERYFWRKLIVCMHITGPSPSTHL